MSTRTKRGSYPHPVLDASDDVASTIEAFNLSVAPTVDDVEIKFQIRMDDPCLQERIDAGHARYSFRWKCGSTIQTRELKPEVASQHADSTGYVAWIAQEDIRRTVRLEIKVVAIEHIDDYALERQHPDYGDAKFAVLPGDILADAGFVTFEPDKLYDPLRPPVGSCFKFVSESKLKKGVRVSFNDDEYVLVAFPEKILAGLAGLAVRPDLQISLVVLPALMETITFIKENADPATGEDLSDKLWHQAILRLVDGVGSLDDRAFDLAQRILGNPLDISLSTPLRTDEDD